MTAQFFSSAAFVGFVILAAAAGYVFGAYVLFRIGRKFGIGSFGEYCVPIYNYVLLCRCAAVSPWMLLLLFVPLANIGFTVYLWGTIARKLDRDFWLFGLGALLLGISVLVLAFDDSRPAGRPDTLPRQPATAPHTAGMPPQRPSVGPGQAAAPQRGTVAVNARGIAPRPAHALEPAIYCTAGEFSGNRVPVGTDGIVIGRNPRAAQLVLSSHEISAAHARLWADLEGRVWIQDMDSLNGTYYCQSEGEPPDWLEVKQPTLLARGARVRLGDGAAEFTVS